MEQALTFDDIILRPQYNEWVGSRSKDCDTTIEKWGIKFGHPLMPANMDTVCESGMLREVYKSGGLGFIHRFMEFEKQITMVCDCIRKQDGYDDVFERGDYSYFPITVGVNGPLGENYIDRTIMLLDVAHADSKIVYDRIKEIRKGFTGPLIVGNIATYGAAIRMIAAGVDGIKVGIGSGSICATRLVTGFGVPQVTALNEVMRAVEDTAAGQNRDKFAIISDGGVRDYGDIAKAIALGADFIMSGRLFAGCPEAPGERIQNTKVYRGMASFPAQEDNGNVGQVPEGVAVQVPTTRSASRIFKEAKSALQSSMSYNGVSYLSNFYGNAEIQLQTERSRIEGRTL